jgi:propanediol utilization protein
MSLDEAKAFGVVDGEYADVELKGERRTLFYDVQIRAHKDFRLEMHIDTDDANAAGVGNGFKAKLIKRR